MRFALTLLSLGLLAACGNDADPGPGNVTVGEARALDEAAAIVEEGRPQLPGGGDRDDNSDETPEGESEDQSQ